MFRLYLPPLLFLAYLNGNKEKKFLISMEENQIEEIEKTIEKTIEKLDNYRSKEGKETEKDKDYEY